MRLCTYRDRGGPRLGSVDDGTVVPLAGRDVADALERTPGARRARRSRSTAWSCWPRSRPGSSSGWA